MGGLAPLRGSLDLQVRSYRWITPRLSQIRGGLIPEKGPEGACPRPRRRKARPSDYVQCGLVQVPVPT